PAAVGAGRRRADPGGRPTSRWWHGRIVWRSRPDQEAENAMSSVTSARPRLGSHDPAGIDALLSEEERAVRQAVRDFCADKINPHIAQWYENGEFPQARGLARELGKIGLLGMHLTGYGCAGMSAV